MHIHILGICGTFMGGVASLANASGYRVTGCDTNVYPPMSTQLQSIGIELIEGFDKKQTELKPDLYVIGNVVSRGNPLMEEIMNQGLPYISGPQWLYEAILKDKWVLAVAGTHGKTTTTSMLAWILEFNGYAPGFLIGGVPLNFDGSARLPQKNASNETSPFFVIEADEYDTAFFDKRSKFVHYHPKTAILNNLEYDHADIFPDLHAIETQFHHMVRMVPGIGRVIINDEEDSLKRVIEKGCWSEKAYIGSKKGLSVGKVNQDQSFEVLNLGKLIGALSWDLLGHHNRMNALAAIAASHHVGVSLEDAIEALQTFKNVKRRMECIGEKNGITIYDDFAHHPAAISTTLAGLRAKVGKARIIAVLEPRSNTMKLGTMKSALPESLKDADQVFCYGEKLTWNAEEALAPIKNKSFVGRDMKIFVEAILKETKSGDHILVMSNGSFNGIHQTLLKGLA
ncbi:UDP-N-acetylmuramate:L-alanyl-gamma-D-glutamyl-meso-diaminopimelate ligase [Candidatus Methylopumilus planktonicus]|uniref:UDP-N-acetylmuramate:L-alanyl-gamma-D-glutamyl- meso-diaminopimelate ligase n=1 Tax=Candidatus Methylopumilus planktonicus TaxID=1581557 RepID=UPI001120E04D|nr:UDP-N-acetylmuramate:L-alanyl-gamma-D-glutamyl-meso-diaminopimelate ligase [Candidatus Methylopumilus planktonicus]QDD11439.1 UDP-N-acetylmuramate:L-alanyl-gamma-D-glutamyl-meso-diaminopimelate ligase [Candidatus Methylopumilus planktonicus]QDD23910.1 UDP-N-acetylmuramate:L-alanyl-gamma-D-glutamyl-meso-diaminopimelate ligase [Candidatus Methylopumilus planktonicus]